MFTGLVRDIGTLAAITPAGGTLRLDITAPATAQRVAVGDSVAVDGICLTVTRTGARSFSVEAVGETRRLTTLGAWRRGRRLHLEPALRVGDPLDGHLMQGHVDGVGEVTAVRRSGGGLAVTIGAAAEQRRFLTPKGSVGVDGVSLTVDEGPFTTGFTVNLIPHTLAATHFDRLRPGDRVNLEMDVLVKAVRTGDMGLLPHLVRDGGARNDDQAAAPGGGLTMERLMARGAWRRSGRGGPKG
ncbi:MAG TPA: riboflavin synthase [Candidatus Krumholzibacteria bacterium]|nr:riboflavin synthase [Candidatus Krumholzibacteria bacterium]